MFDVLIWWLALDAVAVLALPITLRMLRFLPDAGLGFVRQVGLVLIGYLFWLLVTLHMLPNTVPAIVSVLLLVGGVSWWTWRRQRPWLVATLQGHLKRWLAIEIIFALALVGFCLFRAYNPDIAATEKPMEFAFINGILNSRTFPPKDPWLAGYGISYYYFGYVIVAMLTKLTGIGSNVSFNLTGATLFALTVTGAYSLVSNMVQVARRRQDAQDESDIRSRRLPSGLFGGLAALFVALLGNLEGIFELIRARGWGSEALWAWLDVKNLGATPVSTRWYPDDMWWWWRASRVIHDKNALGHSVEVIDEFPFFSFLLGDNHPHVLALPFVLLALALAFNLLCSRGQAEQDESWRSSASTERGLLGSLEHFMRSLWPGSVWDWLLWGVCLGAIGFLNTWDLPIYWGIFVLAYAMLRHSQGAGLAAWLRDTVTVAMTLLALALLLYAPFYIGFRSQAGGIGSVEVKTRLHQYLLMMGTFVVGVLGLLGVSLRRWLDAQGASRQLPLLAQVLGALLGLLMFFAASQGWWTAALLFGLMAATAVLLIWSTKPDDQGTTRLDRAGQFALLLVVCGLLLTVSVEFIYLRDTFDSRMNTVFKFYYQAWVLLGIAAAYGLFAVTEQLGAMRWSGRLVSSLWLGVMTVLVLSGASYTVMATVSKANGFGGEPTLDGTRYIAQYRPDDQAAIDWLTANALADAVMLEAPGGSYSEYNWISAATGIPTLLGWGGHELQWRGNYEVAGAREPDIASIYQSVDAQQTYQLLRRYEIDYVYVGRLERDKYHLSQPTLQKFERIMAPVYQNPSVVIYGWPR